MLEMPGQDFAASMEVAISARQRTPLRRTVSNSRSFLEQKQEMEATRSPPQEQRTSDTEEGECSMFEVGEYYIHERIGKGAQGEVFLGSHKETGAPVAVKVCRKKRNEENGKDDAAELLKEAAVLSSLEHSHIIRMLDVFETKKRVIVVMEYAAKGDLGNYIKQKGRLTWKKAIHIFKQLIRAVSYFHSCNIIHRDLKPENILLDERGNVKIGDWGFAARWSSFKQKNRGVGSPHYVAYEVLFNKKYTGPEVDIWSLGGIFFTMLTGQPPFSARFESDVVRQVRKVQWWNSTEQLHSLPLPIINLLRSIFTADPLKRATMLDIRKQLRQIESLSKAKMLQPADTQIPGSPPLVHVVTTTKGSSKKKRKRAPPSRGARSNLRPIIEE